MTSSSRTQHLTDLEFSDLLAGEVADEETHFHLAKCEYCRSELASVKTSLASFSGVSTHWAHTVAPSRIPAPSRWALRLGAIPTWKAGLAATACTGLLAFSFGPFPRTQPRTPVVPVATAVVVPSKTELANDNRLMLSIDQELSYQNQSIAAASRRSSGSRRMGHQEPDAVID